MGSHGHSCALIVRSEPEHCLACKESLAFGRRGGVEGSLGSEQGAWAKRAAGIPIALRGIVIGLALGGVAVGFAAWRRVPCKSGRNTAGLFLLW